MRTVIVVSNDERWNDQIKLGAAPLGIALEFVPELYSQASAEAVSRGNLIVVDTGIIPTPESREINAVNHILRGRDVVAVYTPGGVALSDVRKAFIVGAQDVFEKPYTERGIRKLIEHFDGDRFATRKTSSWSVPRVVR